jgi:hypothetical protein
MTSREPKKIPNKKAKRWERDRESGFDASKRWDKKWYKAHDACLLKREPNLNQ